MKADVKKSRRIKIPFDEAITLTQNWQANHVIKAFLFHENELSCISEVSGCEKVRFYLGMNNTQLEMIIVAVDQNLNDIINPGPNSNIYNFALPCPSTCDTNSPFYHSIIPPEDNIQTGIPSQNYRDCIESLQEIHFDTAFQWTLAWQINSTIKSFLFDLNQLELAMKNIHTSRVRVYFGSEENNVYAIIVGVDDLGRDVVSDFVQVNEPSPCGTAGVLKPECDESSPLYHNV